MNAAKETESELNHVGNGKALYFARQASQTCVNSSYASREVFGFRITLCYVPWDTLDSDSVQAVQCGAI